MSSRIDNPIFTDWKPETAQLWGQIPLLLRHGLADTGLFTDAALAELIDGYPRDDYALVIPGRQDEPQHARWTEGDIGEATGAQVLEAIRNGFLWLNLRNLPRNDARFAALAERIRAEMEERAGLKIDIFEMTLLITSPGAQTYYHCDVPGQSLWHIRGRKRVWLYPATEAFMPAPLLEEVIMQIREEEIPYHAWYDDYAQVVDMEPGMMTHWPQYGPHRVTNLDGLNVSITTEHWTEELARAYKVRYANGLLRRAGFTPKSTATSGIGYHAKAALQSVWRRTRAARLHQWARHIEFRLDPEHPGRVVEIEPYDLKPRAI